MNIVIFFRPQVDRKSILRHVTPVLYFFSLQVWIFGTDKNRIYTRKMQQIIAEFDSVIIIFTCAAVFGNERATRPAKRKDRWDIFCTVTWLL